ncbi:hypothetical protein HNR62_000282 [Oceanisphaera litoralis]|uniref:DUF4376 domain-containing protein n=1 Tax=Oceanisphaera litoralis TaxID=225144 RepID=UPI00195702F3|nr:DUF4376 domain-containing protein [Oceanisphaera litoralis]MBM7454453.1 hypothetical protein [Oceanisphaera litoralis]
MKIQHKTPDKSLRVNVIRQQQIDAGFQWGGWAFDIDPGSLTLIAGRALRLTLDPSISSVSWRTQDNQIAVMTREEFLAFAQGADAHIDALFKQSWLAKDS